MEWYVSRDGQRWGPFSFYQMESAASNGRLQSDDFVWRAGMDNWTRACDVPGLLAPPPVPGSTKRLGSKLPPSLNNAQADSRSRNNPLTRLWRIVWPDTTLQSGCNKGIAQGFIATAWLAAAHLLDLFLMFGFVNQIRANVAKLAPLDFAEFLSGNTLAQLSLLGLLAAIVCLAVSIRLKSPVLSSAVLIWTCFLLILSSVTYMNRWTFWLFAGIRLLFAINGLRATLGLRARTDERSMPTIRTTV